MFEDVGEKIKKWTEIVFWLDAAGIAIAALVLGAEAGELGFFIALIIAAVLVAGLYIISLVLYGFGELVTNSGKPVAAQGVAGANKSPAKNETAVADDELPEI